MSNFGFLSVVFDEYQLEQIHSALKVINPAYHHETAYDLASCIDLTIPQEQKDRGHGSIATNGWVVYVHPSYGEDQRPRVGVALHSCIVSNILKLAAK